MTTAFDEPLKAYKMILVRTLFPGNLGACARAASNFDVRDTVLVAPFASAQHSEAKRYATNAARDYMDAFKTVADLTMALKDCTAAVGFSVRTGTTRSATIGLGKISSLIKNGSHGAGKVALIFGNEQDGLSGEELLHCTHVCQLPTSSVHPSLNLSHAVAIVLARLYDLHLREMPPAEPVSQNPFERAITLEEWQRLMNQCEELMRRLGPYQEDPERAVVHFRRVVGRLQLKLGELNGLNAFIERIERIVNSKA